MMSRRILSVAIAAALASPLAHATNGMNLEGYGPIATGMGGASMAYDNGTAAVMNNPATLAMGNPGSRVDLAIGELSPDVDASMAGMGSWSSGGDSYLMPAFGYIRNTGKYAFGAGVFAQGGMGTEYSSGGPGAAFGALGNSLAPLGPAMGLTGAGTLSAATAADIGSLEERSEVGVARVIFPLAVNVNDRLNLGASLDWVRATMDVKMFMPGATFGRLAAAGRVSGGLNTALGGLLTGGAITDVYGAYLDFSDSSDFDGAATGSGFAGKLGFTYEISPKLTVGASYHSETNLDDLENGGRMVMYVEDSGGVPPAGLGAGAGADVPVTLTGDVKVHGFEWPETYAIGFSYRPNDRWMLAADVKQINWSDVMKDFKVTFTADAANPPGFANQSITIAMPQNWDDQTVIQLGASYQMSDQLVLRGGFNRADNPVPSGTVNYLFPATIEEHYTVGLGYAFSDANMVNFSLAYAPEVEVTGTGTDNNGLKVSHSQTNWQLMYSHFF